MDNKDILEKIQALIDEEHQLRGLPSDTDSVDPEQQTRLRRLEEELDQCWDLLRQRRAKAQAGQDPAEAEARPPDEVEHYKQ